MRLLTLLVAMVLSGAVVGSVGMVVYMASNPEEIEARFVLPWLAIGMLVGFGLWLIFSSMDQRSRHRRKHHRI